MLHRLLLASALLTCAAGCQLAHQDHPPSAKSTPLQSLVGRRVRVYVSSLPDASGARLTYLSGTVCQITDGWLVLAAQTGKPNLPNQWISTAYIQWVRPIGDHESPNAP